MKERDAWTGELTKEPSTNRPIMVLVAPGHIAECSVIRYLGYSKTHGGQAAIVSHDNVEFGVAKIGKGWRKVEVQP
jgi:hypothetical protein